MTQPLTREFEDAAFIAVTQRRLALELADQQTSKKSPSRAAPSA